MSTRKHRDDCRNAVEPDDCVCWTVERPDGLVVVRVIERGQKWRRKDDGDVATIVGVCDDKVWWRATDRMSFSYIDDFVIWKYWELIENAPQRPIGPPQSGDATVIVSGGEYRRELAEKIVQERLADERSTKENDEQCKPDPQKTMLEID